MKRLAAIIGIPELRVSHHERLVSALGGLVAILAILLVSHWSVGAAGATLIVASMGASAVLIFAVPHGQLSQPWPLVGGHLVSALVGVTCAWLVPQPFLAAAVAVGLAIGLMYYLRCIHPPGGATALTAVVGGSAVHDLGYTFVLTPVLLNTLTILAVGVLFNAPFAWRRYPAALQRWMAIPSADGTAGEAPPIAHEDFVYALSQVDSFIDVSEQDLLRIYDVATRKSREARLDPQRLEVGACYSNGRYGEEWSVRHVVDASDDGGGDGGGDGRGGGSDGRGQVVYRVVAGQGRRSSGYCSRAEFLAWARHRVVRDEDNWKRVD
jgi:CBS domain-containing membrane protein